MNQLYVGLIVVYVVLGFFGLMIVGAVLRWMLGINRIIALLERIAGPEATKDRKGNLLERGIGKVIDAAQKKPAE